MKWIICCFLLCLATLSFGQNNFALEPVEGTRGTITVKKNQKLRAITQQKVKMNKINRFDGYRIELYQGRNRKDAEEILQKFKEEYKTTPAEIVFERPNVKIKVGIYRNKLEAQKLLSEMRKEYPAAKIVRVKGLPFPPFHQGEKEEE